MKKLFFPLLILFIINISSEAQSVNEYKFKSSSGSYTPLNTLSETVLWSGTFDNNVQTITIPGFVLAEKSYTSMTVSSNGFVTFGATLPLVTTYNPVSSTTAYEAALSPLGFNLLNSESGSPKISYNTSTGGEIVVQWQDVKRSGTTGEAVSFQLRLNPTTSQISFVYGPSSTSYEGTSYAIQAGMRGASNSDYNNRTTTTNWSATTAGTSSSASCRFNNIVYPASGLTFKWKPLYNPSGFTSTALDFSNISLNWTKSPLNHNVIIAVNTTATFGTPADGTAYNSGDPISGGGTVINNGSGSNYSHTSLSQSTLYYYKIWSYDAETDYSSGITTSTRTAYPLAYQQDFNTTSLPAEWTTDMASFTSHGIAGTRAISKRLYSSVTTAYATSPLTGNISTDSYLSFHYRIIDNTGYPLNASIIETGDKIEIQVSTDDGSTFSTIYTIDNGNHTPSTIYATRMISLAAYNGSFIRIRFLITRLSGDYYADIDNIIIANGSEMVYAAATTEQPNISIAGIGTTNNDIIRLAVITQRETSPLLLTQITFNTTGSTNSSGDIAAAKVFHTTTPEFSSAVQFGTTLNNPSGTFSITGSRVLAPGHNFFWLTYDIRSTATPGNTIDAQCTQFITSESATPKTPASVNPAGTRLTGMSIGGTKTIPGDYLTIASAVEALNAGTIADGGVLFNVTAGHMETSTTPIILTATGKSGSPVTFIKNGAGENPVITRTDAGTINTSSPGNHGDAVLIAEGSDFVTFDGIDVSASDQGIEYGYYIRKASVTNACSNVAIKNSEITMNKGTSRFVIGICVANNSTSSSNISITTGTGAHDNITITGNIIDNVFTGIFLKGHDGFNDQNFTIGADGSGNIIRNYGGNASYETTGIRIENINLINVCYNNIDNTAGGGTPFTGAAGYGIYNIGVLSNSFNAANNIINVATVATSYGQNLFGIKNLVNGAVNIENNTITLSSGISTAIGFYYISNEPNTASSEDIRITGNQFGATGSPHTGVVYLINNPNSQVSPAVTEIRNNSVTGTLSRSVDGGSIYLYYNNNSPTGTEIISGNNFSNISQRGNSTFYGIWSTTTTGHAHAVYNNTISNIESGSGAFTAINLGSSSSRSVYNNRISGVVTSGTITAISNGSGNIVAHIYGNEISNMSSSSVASTGSVVSGVSVTAGTAVYLYNNYISDLHVTAAGNLDGLRGISITSTQANSDIGLYYNTIYLNSSSSGANFGSSAVYHTASLTATTAKLDMRNNILVNTSVANGTGRTSALRRSVSWINNFAETSDNNILYAGTPGARNVIHYNGDSYQTLEAYKAEVAPREASSHTEMPPFVNINTKPYNLRMKTDLPALAEGTAQVISTPVSITTDYDGEQRGTNPDIGADEFEGIIGFVENPASFEASPASSQQNKLSFSKNSAGNNVVIVFNTTGIFTVPAGVPVPGGALAGGTVVYSGETSPYLHGSLTTGSTYYYKAFSYNGSSYSAGLKVSSVPGVAPVTSLKSAAAGKTAVYITWTRNIAGNDVLIASNSVYMSGNPVNGTLYNTGDLIPGGGTVIYRGPAASYDHTALTEWSQYYYKAWSVDAFNYHSTAATSNCITYSSTVTSLPYLQNFDGTWSHTPAAPQGWEVADIQAGYTWEINTSLQRSHPASVRGKSDGACEDYLISPPVLLPDTDIQLSWWNYISDATGYSSYKVLLSTTGKDVSSFTTELGNYTCSNNTWEIHNISLNSFRGQTVHIAFLLYDSKSHYDYFLIDDILIETLIPGAAVLPTPANGLKVFSERQLLKWAPPPSAIPVTGYKVYFGTQPVPNTLVYDGPETSFLTAATEFTTTYFWKVVPYNIYGSAIDVPVWSFTTLRQSQIAESFEDEWSPPAGWSMDVGYNWYQTSDSEFHREKSLYRTTGTTQAKLHTPKVSIVNGDRLEFYAGTAASVYQRIRIFYSADKITWTAIGDEISVSPAAWTQYSTDLSPLAGGEYYLGISAYYAPGGGSAKVYIDYVTGPDLAPVLPSPARQIAPAEADEWLPATTDLNWWPGITGGVPSGYRIYAGTDGNGTSTPSNLANGIIVSVPTWDPPGTLNDNTQYYWQVIPFNVLGDASGCPVWSFKTAPSGGVQIGRDGVDYLDQPVHPEYEYSYTQAIYLKEEINISGKEITRIYYQWNGGTGGEFCRDWEIFIGHTAKSVFTERNEWVPVSQMTKVFDGEVILPVEPGWIAIELDVAFPYNNSDNLVIAVHENTPGWESGLYFLGTDTETKRSLVFYDDYNDPDPVSPPQADFIHYGVANIRLQLSVLTSLSENIAGNGEKSSLLLYPNPATEKLNVVINSNLTDVKQLSVYDLNGRIVMTIENPAPAERYEIDLTNLPKGIYILHLRGSNGLQLTGRFSVM